MVAREMGDGGKEGGVVDCCFGRTRGRVRGGGGHLGWSRVGLGQRCQGGVGGLGVGVVMDGTVWVVMVVVVRGSWVADHVAAVVMMTDTVSTFLSMPEMTWKLAGLTDDQEHDDDAVIFYCSFPLHHPFRRHLWSSDSSYYSL